MRRHWKPVLALLAAVSASVAVTLIGSAANAAPGCDPNYHECVPVARDVDCEGGGGNGPEFVAGPIRVIGEDVYELDDDGDGIACDNGSGNDDSAEASGSGGRGGSEAAKQRDSATYRQVGEVPVGAADTGGR